MQASKSSAVLDNDIRECAGWDDGERDGNPLHRFEVSKPAPSTRVPDAVTETRLAQNWAAVMVSRPANPLKGSASPSNLMTDIVIRPAAMAGTGHERP